MKREIDWEIVKQKLDIICSIPNNRGLSVEVIANVVMVPKTKKNLDRINKLIAEIVKGDIQ